MHSSIYEQLPQVLLPWYTENRRDLPWRRDKEPYHIWISEIMLQQTRVEAVKGYYTRFLQTLPTVSDLANCPDELLHKLWEGLGYYSRVRNLKKAAQRIQGEFGGDFPGEYEKVLSLPGIGQYTAGAICSICYDLPTPAVDGNVLRVAARLTNSFEPIDSPSFKKEVFEELRAVYPAEAGDFTQALMELGATVCGPNRQPACESCPCKAFCLAYQARTQLQLPVKTPKKPRTEEKYTVFILSHAGKYALEKRSDSGLLAGLWQFPNAQGRLDTQQSIKVLEEKGIFVTEVYRQLERKHIFTHIVWQMRGFFAEVSQPIGDYTWLSPQEIDSQAALPTAFRQFWEVMRHV